MRAGFLQTRKFFFVTVVVFHAIITLVAAVDVSSDHTRHYNVHLTAAVLNFAINLFSFITITLLALLDSIDQESRWYVSQVRFEVALVSFVTCLQLVNGIAYAASLPRFGCTDLDTTCTTVGRLVLVGSWIVTTLCMVPSISLSSYELSLIFRHVLCRLLQRNCHPCRAACEESLGHTHQIICVGSPVFAY